jgi:hypothetical protein
VESSVKSASGVLYVVLLQAAQAGVWLSMSLRILHVLSPRVGIYMCDDAVGKGVGSTSMARIHG